MKLLTTTMDSAVDEKQTLGVTAPGVKRQRKMNKPRPLPLRWDEIEEVFKGWLPHAAADKNSSDIWNSLLEDLRMQADRKSVV